MSKFIRNLALFVAGLPLTIKAAPVPVSAGPSVDDPSKTVSLRPLNLDINNLFASHRSHSSHSSHRSHSSHYSGSGGGSSYVSPSTTSAGQEASAAGANTLAQPSSTYPAGISASTAPSSLANAGAPQAQPLMSADEKRRLQIMRVQIKLLSLGIYSGRVSGVLDGPTKQSIRLFQNLKHLPETGLMTTATMNALGVPTVN